MRGANGKLLDIEGISYVYPHYLDATFWKQFTVVVTTHGNHCLISLKDQKHMLLIQQQYPVFLGKGKQSRKASTTKPKQRDFGIDIESDSEREDQSSDSDSEAEETTGNNIQSKSEIEEVTGENTQFEAEIEADSI